MYIINIILAPPGAVPGSPGAGSAIMMVGSEEKLAASRPMS